MNKAEEMRELRQEYFDTFFNEEIYQAILSLIRIKASRGEYYIRIYTTESEEKYYKSLVKKLREDGFHANFFTPCWYTNESYIYISWS